METVSKIVMELAFLLLYLFRFAMFMKIKRKINLARELSDLAL